MMSTARKPSDLIKRIRRFLARERGRDRTLANLFERCLQSCGEVYLFGGVVRDIALHGISRLDTDIDLVCMESRGGIWSWVKASGLSSRRNKFGGCRVETDRWLVDLWRVEDTWAFNEGGCQYTGVESLLDTTITNWESILYGLRGQKLIYAGNYFEDLKERYLDVIHYRNPNPLGMYVRILRAYGLRDAAILSGKAVRVVNGALKTYSFGDVSAYEKNHYQFQYISKDVYNLFSERVQEPNLFPIRLREGTGLLLWETKTEGATAECGHRERHGARDSRDRLGRGDRGPARRRDAEERVTDAAQDDEAHSRQRHGVVRLVLPGEPC